MDQCLTLDQHIERYAHADPLRAAVGAAVRAIAAASIDIAELIAHGDLAGRLGRACGRNADGDVQKALDLEADALVRKALASVPVALLLSEESPVPESIDGRGLIAVAVDPLDGSSNIDANMCVGTIFSILPMTADPALAFLQPGSGQLAAGFVIYGPQTSLVLTLGDGVRIFTRDPRDRTFKLARSGVRIPSRSHEFAINASNQRHWDPPIRAYIEDCLAGADGEAAANMRWIGSLVADAYRILSRGGIFLYPADGRKGYADGRLRLLYEAHPMAFIVEQAGGGATTGAARILDVAARDPHQRVPLIMGSIENVRTVERLHLDTLILAERNAPLFATRGFFRI
ncbi:class 1 fructose-bisphosphatase [Telmatospirillum siberiense]|uniref:Fructose-1,6-bisphosphatase class 1 n=1 Tax=Telmatospirillum siberiense TaxID=382514 RepID=A0A2N3PXQ8_9PROT|nr:class 1 fructose-bisphosphatase [Telmatospirillum siberiense]PKU25192.1 class 1 fructose-bisphosphatase [Telmatospirillum siberiense]